VLRLTANLRAISFLGTPSLTIFTTCSHRLGAGVFALCLVSGFMRTLQTGVGVALSIQESIFELAASSFQMARQF
jgi:hypothetical protein